MPQPVPCRWYKPTPEDVQRASLNRDRGGQTADATRSFTQPTPGLNRLSVAGLDLVSQVGVPVPASGIKPKDFAVYLLRLTAEVEHALMAQYLYAAASLDPTRDTSPGNYVLKVMRVAIQEMGHLATVQNLLLLTGGPTAAYLQRDVIRRVSELNPIPFVLEPVGPAAVAKFVVAEMPACIPSIKVEQVGRLLTLAKKDSGTVPHRVGAIYSVLRWLYMPKDEANAWLDLTSLAGFPEDFHVTDADLTPAADMDALEARADEWRATGFGLILESPRTCAQTVVAIDRVSDQGEGWTAAEDTHFAEFLELDDAIQKGLPPDLVRPIARSPTLTPGLGGERHVLIEDGYTKAWGRVFSLQYSLLVLSIYHALLTRRPSDDTPGLRGGLIDLALQGMGSAIIPVSKVLTGLPLRSGEAALAGPPYDLDPEVVTLAAPSALRARHLTMLNALSTLYTQIESDAAFPKHQGHDNVILGLKFVDEQRRELFR